MLGQEELAALRVNGSQSIWVARNKDEVDDDLFYQMLFDSVREPRLPMSKPSEIATLGLIVASLEPEVILYYPALSAAIHADKFQGEHEYKYDPSFHNFTRSLIANMFSGGVRIRVD